MKKINVLKEALYEFPIEEFKFNIPDWVGILNNTNPLKQKFINKIKDSIINVEKLKDVEKINLTLEDNSEITSSYISSLDTDNSVYDIKYNKKVIVIGNEANGVSKEVQEMADKKVIIPMLGKTESLNASVAAGIMIYEYVRGKIKKD